MLVCLSRANLKIFIYQIFLITFNFFLIFVYRVLKATLPSYINRYVLLLLHAISPSKTQTGIVHLYAASLIDQVKVLRPTRHKTGHFGDVFPSLSLGLVLKNGNKHNNMHPRKHILQHKINQNNYYQAWSPPTTSGLET